MKPNARLNRVQKQIDAARPQRGPLTLFLREARPDLPVGRRDVWGGIGLEIVFDPAAGLPAFPPGCPHKLIYGMDPDWV